MKFVWEPDHAYHSPAVLKLNGVPIAVCRWYAWNGDSNIVVHYAGGLVGKASIDFGPSKGGYRSLGRAMVATERKFDIVGKTEDKR